MRFSRLSRATREYSLTVKKNETENGTNALLLFRRQRLSARNTAIQKEFSQTTDGSSNDASTHENRLRTHRAVSVMPPKDIVPSYFNVFGNDKIYYHNFGGLVLVCFEADFTALIEIYNICALLQLLNPILKP